MHDHPPIELPDLNEMLDEVMAEADGVVVPNHTVCRGCIDVGFLLAQRAFIRGAVLHLTDDADRVAAVGIAQDIEQRLRQALAAKVITATPTD